MDILIDNIALQPDREDEGVPSFLLNHYAINKPSYRIVRKSLDCRDTANIVYRYRIVVSVEDELGERLLSYPNVSLYAKREDKISSIRAEDLRAIIVGSGPAGLFCALRIIECGGSVDIFERGKSIDDRYLDIVRMEEEGILNSDSNVLFGEGGAGTYSDGKLNTRTHRPEIEYVFRKLIDFGAPGSIQYDSKPHLGSDVIRRIIKNIREHIIKSGSRILFHEKITDLIVEKNTVIGVVTGSNKELRSNHIILAIGHSARDTYELLEKKGIALGKKGFAVGIRIEHPAEYINYLIYRKSRFRDILPAAQYAMTYTDKKTGRGIYTFCMCPGGSVINSSSEEEFLCINGMSYSGRVSDFSNSAVVVTVAPDDTPEGVMGGVQFQRNMEHRAFVQAGGNYHVPAQSLVDFMDGKESGDMLRGSYKPGLVIADLAACISPWIADSIKLGLKHFDSVLRGFIGGEGVCMGVETRTSSPVRILREDDYQSVSHKGLYPIGEGSGYAGGIISSAVDGIKAAEAIIGAMTA